MFCVYVTTRKLAKLHYCETTDFFSDSFEDKLTPKISCNLGALKDRRFKDSDP